MNVECGLVLGIDLGWSERRRTTCACVLSWTDTAIEVQSHALPLDSVQRPAVLKSLLGDATVLALAVDGPVRGALDEIGIYRLAEKMLTRRFQEHIGKPGQTSSPNGRQLNRAANDAVKAVLAAGVLGTASHRVRIHDLAFVEAFPTSFLGVMVDDGKAPPHGPRSDAYYEHLLGPDSRSPARPKTNRLLSLLRSLVPGRAVAARALDTADHEERAAIICALTALCVVARRYVAVGDPSNGYIILPPRAEGGAPGLQPWTSALLQANAPDSGSLVEEMG